jgi:hypothetical protein
VERARLASLESGLHIALRAISDFGVACSIVPAAEILEDFFVSETTNIAIDETSYTLGQRHLTLVADADARVSKGASVANIARLGQITTDFMDVINGTCSRPLNARARGYLRFDTMTTVVFLIAGRLDFGRDEPPCRLLT